MCWFKCLFTDSLSCSVFKGLKSHFAQPIRWFQNYAFPGNHNGDGHVNSPSKFPSNEQASGNCVRAVFLVCSSSTHRVSSYLLTHIHLLLGKIMILLFLACLEPRSGNRTTAERIRSHIESAGHTCELRHAQDFESSSDVANLLSQNPQFEGALAIHLFKAGRLLLDIQVPFGIIFGGTDINEDVKVETRRVVMEKVLHKARFAVAFTDKLKKEAGLYLHSQSSKIFVQPQGIETQATEDFSWSEFLRRSDVSGVHVQRLRVFLLICGLRRVKDPLYLVERFSEWHSENPQNVLVIIGPKIDPVLTDEVEAVVKRTAGVFLARERSRPELHAAMKRCFAVVNSSVSEGMSAAILEAMDLGLPVVARDIPGNRAVVQHEVTGLLYSSPQEFVHQSQRLLSDHELRARLIRNGKVYVVKHHSLKQERETYLRLMDTLH